MAEVVEFAAARSAADFAFAVVAEYPSQLPAETLPIVPKHCQQVFDFDLQSDFSPDLLYSEWCF